MAGADGAVSNFMHLLDDFITFKTKAAQKEVDVHIYQCGCTEITSHLLKEECTYDRYYLHDDVEDYPLKYFEAQPIYGKKAHRLITTYHTCLNIRCLSSHHIVTY